VIQSAYLPVTGGAVLYDAALQSEPGDHWFDVGAWQERQGVVGRAGAGRGSVWFVESDDGVWALRHYCRGGLVSRLIDDHYLWLGEERTRSFQEWRLLVRLRELGLPVPAPVAARYLRRGPLYRADLITAFVDAPSFQNLMLEGGLTDTIWFRVGEVLRRFHEAGIYHADLNIRNMLVGPGEQVCLLDFDRGRHREQGPWQQRNLQRLERSMHKICAITGASFDARGWQQLLDGYQSAQATKR
jgi:3-deoxy-D-manno-octulosonic acid kinase